MMFLFFLVCLIIFGSITTLTFFSFMTDFIKMLFDMPKENDCNNW